MRGYSVYTGYSGWMHSRVLPAITVNLRSFTKEQEPSLKADPPSFEEGLAWLMRCSRAFGCGPPSR